MQRRIRALFVGVVHLGVFFATFVLLMLAVLRSSDNRKAGTPITFVPKGGSSLHIE